MSTKETTETALDLLNAPPMSHETAVGIFTSAVKNPADVTAESLREALAVLGLAMDDLRRDRNLFLQLEGINRELADAEDAQGKAMAAVDAHNQLCVPVKKQYDDLAVEFRRLEFVASAATGKCNHLAGKRSDLIQSLNRNFDPPQSQQTGGRMSFPRVATA